MFDSRTTVFFGLLFFSLTPRPFAQTPDALLKAVDKNMTFGTRSVLAEMTIVTPQGEQHKTLRIFSDGWEKVFVHFEVPAKDAGSKFLKIEKNLWAYFPKAEKVIKISGHLLREGMMGSDFSYEDMTETRTLADQYDAVQTGEDTLGGQPCAVLMLTEKQRGLSYPKRKMWVNREQQFPVKEELYGFSGALMKTVEYGDMRLAGSRLYPHRFAMTDKLRKGSGTTIVYKELKFNLILPKDVFEQRVLTRPFKVK